MKERFGTLFDAKQYVKVYHRYEDGMPFTITQDINGHYIVSVDYASKLDPETKEEKLRRKRNDRLNELLGE